MDMVQGPQWQPIEMLGAVFDLVCGMTQESREQRKLFGKAEVSTLDRATVERTRRAYADRLDLIRLFREQVSRWRKDRLSRDQEMKSNELGRLLDEDERLCREILGIAGYVAPQGKADRKDKSPTRN
jgi:hypothetical protein